MKELCIQMIDNNVTKDWWIRLVARFVKVGDEFEILCWNDENTEISQASLYGNAINKENEISIKGTMTGELFEILLEEEPKDKSIYNKMTQFFTINVRGDNYNLCSAHYGTEMYVGTTSIDDFNFCKRVMEEYGESFSVNVIE